MCTHCTAYRPYVPLTHSKRNCLRHESNRAMNHRMVNLTVYNGWLLCSLWSFTFNRYTSFVCFFFLRLEFLSKQSLQWFIRSNNNNSSSDSTTHKHQKWTLRRARFRTHTHMSVCDSKYSRDSSPAMIFDFALLCFGSRNHTWTYMFALCIFNAEVWPIRNTIVKFSRRL